MSSILLPKLIITFKKFGTEGNDLTIGSTDNARLAPSGSNLGSGRKGLEQTKEDKIGLTKILAENIATSAFEIGDPEVSLSFPQSELPDPSCRVIATLFIQNEAGFKLRLNPQSNTSSLFAYTTSSTSNGGFSTDEVLQIDNSINPLILKIDGVFADASALNFQWSGIMEEPAQPTTLLKGSFIQVIPVPKSE